MTFNRRPAPPRRTPRPAGLRPRPADHRAPPHRTPRRPSAYALSGAPPPGPPVTPHRTPRPTDPPATPLGHALSPAPPSRSRRRAATVAPLPSSAPRPDSLPSFPSEDVRLPDQPQPAQGAARLHQDPGVGECSRRGPPAGRHRAGGALRGGGEAGTALPGRGAEMAAGGVEARVRVACPCRLSAPRRGSGSLSSQAPPPAAKEDRTSCCGPTETELPEAGALRGRAELRWLFAGRVKNSVWVRDAGRGPCSTRIPLLAARPI